MPKNDHTPTNSRQPVSLDDDARQQVPHLLEGLSADERSAQVAGESWSCPWDEFICDVAIESGVDALVVRRGTFRISDHVRVAYKDPDGFGVETGWSAVRLTSIDGKARSIDLKAPQIVISPDARCLILQPKGGPRGQRRIGFAELCELLADMGEAQRAAGGSRRAAR